MNYYFLSSKGDTLICFIVLEFSAFKLKIYHLFF